MMIFQSPIYQSIIIADIGGMFINIDRACVIFLGYHSYSMTLKKVALHSGVTKTRSLTHEWCSFKIRQLSYFHFVQLLGVWTMDIRKSLNVSRQMCVSDDDDFRSSIPVFDMVQSVGDINTMCVSNFCAIVAINTTQS